MIFLVFDHGAALNMVGARRNAKQYLIGNPLTAIQMSQHDIRAALYAPLRVLVYEQKAGQTIVEYDQPSSLFGQFGGKRYGCCLGAGYEARAGTRTGRRAGASLTST